ncbi:hypothetical protein ACFPTX_16380 [Pseudomonas sp. GCM10022188]|nr:hypothetical protein [Pseudomonas oryzagri]
MKQRLCSRFTDTASLATMASILYSPENDGPQIRTSPKAIA